MKHKNLFRNIKLGILFGAFFVLIVTGCGGGGGGSGGTTPPVAAVMSLLAGNVGGSGSLDGTGAEASFWGATGVATDASGNIYVADTSNRTIRKISPAGVVTTFAGTTLVQGSSDGIGTAATFRAPAGVAVDSTGNVYVADTDYHTIRKITSAGLVTTFAGLAFMSGSADGTGVAARFKYPMGVAVDSADSIYVADSGNHTIRKITPAGVVTTLAGTAGVSGSSDNTGSAAGFNTPYGVACDSAGNVYVADRSNHTIRKITPTGVVTTLAGTAGLLGSADGNGASARFSWPTSVLADSAGNVYVTDWGNYTLRKITSAGVVTTLAGTAGQSGSVDGAGAAARFTDPEGVAIDSAGSLYVADDTTIRKVTGAGVVTTLAGTPYVAGSTDGTGAAAAFGWQPGVAADSSGNVFVADSYNQTIRKITAAGVVTTLAGSTRYWGNTDGLGAAASFRKPQGITTDNAGNIYVADYFAHTIRKITSAGAVTTLAGTADVSGSVDGTGLAASFNNPISVAADNAGNIYVADYSNHVIRKITSTGVVSTLAGMAGVSGSSDGTGTAARFYYPEGVATDSEGNVYVADAFNNTIRKITPAGVVSTLAGMAGMWGHADGTGAAARFKFVSSVAVDSSNNLYVADVDTIRKVTPAGVVTTVVGSVSNHGFAAGSLPGVISFPASVTLSGRTLYFSMKNGVVQVTNMP